MLGSDKSAKRVSILGLGKKDESALTPSAFEAVGLQVIGYQQTGRWSKVGWEGADGKKSGRRASYAGGRGGRGRGSVEISLLGQWMLRISTFRSGPIVFRGEIM